MDLLYHPYRLPVHPVAVHKILQENHLVRDLYARNIVLRVRVCICLINRYRVFKNARQILLRMLFGCQLSDALLKNQNHIIIYL